MEDDFGSKRKKFNPNDARYYHSFCCGAHVTKAAGSVAFASLILIFLRSIILILARIRGNNFRVATADALYSIGLTTLIDFVCCLVLIYAVLEEARFFVLPYLIHQVYSSLVMVREYYSAMVDDELERKIKCTRMITEFCATYSMASDVFQSLHFNNHDREFYAKISVILIQSCKMGVTYCFCKILFNYFIFLKNRSAEYCEKCAMEDEEMDSYEPIIGETRNCERLA